MISAWRRSFPKSGDEALQGQRADDNRRVEPMRAVMAVSTQRLWSAGGAPGRASLFPAVGPLRPSDAATFFSAFCMPPLKEAATDVRRLMHEPSGSHAFLLRRIQ
jgi:hypothetical protein